MVLSQLFHADDMHLYFNMASLLVKGRSLERRFGSFYFAWMVGNNEGESVRQEDRGRKKKRGEREEED